MTLGKERFPAIMRRMKQGKYSNLKSLMMAVDAVRNFGLKRSIQQNLLLTPKTAKSLAKIGVACRGCMKGTTTISAEYSDGSKTAVMWIQDGEKIVEATGLIIAGLIMTGLSSVALISLLMVWGATRGRKQDGSQKSSIDILEATTNKGVYFRINNPPSSNDAQ